MQALNGEHDYHTISIYENCILYMFFNFASELLQKEFLYAFT